MRFDLETLLANIRDGVYFTDTERRIIYWNKGAEQITGYSAEEVIGRRCQDNLLVHVDFQGKGMCLENCPLLQTIQDHIPRESEVFLKHKQGHRVPVRVRATPLNDHRGRVVGAAEFFTDISSQATMQERVRELELLALLDPLTQLPNRNHIEPELEARFQEMQRLDLHFGLLFLDIDHFKTFNDNYGHPVGDQVLQVVARTLKAAVRPYDMVGRWGGEEFVGIIRNVDAPHLEEIGQRLRELIGNSALPYQDRVLQVTVSIGATLALVEDSIESLVHRADALMYTSKQLGRNRLTIG
jgi:diguanylate cyclase (GGDEF)-like protein/PAS domain S-box-containing protein